MNLKERASTLCLWVIEGEGGENERYIENILLEFFVKGERANLAWEVVV